MKKKLKKLLAGAVALGMLITCMPQVVIAEDYYDLDLYEMYVTAEEKSYGDFQYIEMYDGTLSITGYSGDGGDIEIPSEINETAVTRIGYCAFISCISLTSIKIPDSVTSIGAMAFADCTSLTSVTIPASVTYIGAVSFCLCTSLESITVDSDNESYSSEGGVLFNKNKTELITYPAGKTDTSYSIPSTVTSIETNAFLNCTSLVSVVIPDSVTYIEDLAFQRCSSITSIEIPAGVTYIGWAAFRNCSSLKSITVASDNEYYSSEDGVLFDKDKTELIKYPEGKTDTSYSIPGTVTSIEEEAFYHGTSLTSITIPDSVTSIGSYAFYNCTSLKAAVFYGNETEIDNDVFSGCSDSLTIYGYEDSTAETYANENSIKFALISSYDPDSIYDVLLGDLDGNGEVTVWDSVLLARYLASWDVDIDESAADLDGDSEVTLWDSVLLARQLAGWGS